MKGKTATGVGMLIALFLLSGGTAGGQTSAPAAQRLTVQDAEALALKSTPQISVYHLLSLASGQVTREQKAAYYPTIYGSLTAAEPRDNGSRIAAGYLNNPIVNKIYV